jgi:galactoside O-acetyltransferase
MKNKNLNFQNYLNENDLKNLKIKKVGKNVYLEKSCRVLGFKNIQIGSNVRIDSFCNLIVHNGFLKIEDNVHIGSFCHLVATGGIKLMKYSGLSQGVKVYSASDDFSGKYMTNPTVSKKFTNIKIKPVVLEKHVIIGSNSVILPGSIIHEGAAVGALTLVNKSLDKWTIYQGSPARKIATRSKDLIEKEKIFEKQNII